MADVYLRLNISNSAHWQSGTSSLAEEKFDIRQLNDESMPVDICDSLARGLLALLPGIDRPQLVSDAILRAIIEVPESSS